MWTTGCGSRSCRGEDGLVRLYGLRVWLSRPYTNHQQVAVGAVGDTHVCPMAGLAMWLRSEVLAEA